MKPLGALVLGLTLGLAVGVPVGRSLAIARTAAQDDRVAALETKIEELEERSRVLRQSTRRRGDDEPNEALAPDEASPAPAAPTARPATDSAPAVDAAAESARRASRVNAIRGEADAWFEKGDGEAALAALKELAALAPEGRTAAMELAVRMNEDVNGRNRLKLSVYSFYSGMGDPAVKELMGWSLGNPSPPDFRVMSAYGLPWTQAAESTVTQFAGALETEQDVRVQRALVANLARLSKDTAAETLHGLFLDGSRDAQLRAQIATELALSDDERFVRAIEQAAENDPSDRVRSAAKAALVARDPPATGYLITGTVPQSQGEAAGLAPGDILVSYAGRTTQTADALRQAAKESGDAEQVSVVVVRDGQEVTVLCRPGSLGVYGRTVKAAGE